MYVFCVQLYFMYINVHVRLFSKLILVYKFIILTLLFALENIEVYALIILLI